MHGQIENNRKTTEDLMMEAIKVAIDAKSQAASLAGKGILAKAPAIKSRIHLGLIVRLMSSLMLRSRQHGHIFSWIF